MSKKLNLLGQVFNRLTVIEEAPSRGKHTFWKCVCLCGAEVEVSTSHLRQGRSGSCGCLRKEITAATKTKHGALRGRMQTPEYKAYMQAMMRCTNPNNKRYYCYGERGIRFLFDSYEEFYAEIGNRPSNLYSLDRKNNNGHYEPGNVRWATRVEQANNKRNNRKQRSGTGEEPSARCFFDPRTKLYTEMV